MRASEGLSATSRHRTADSQHTRVALQISNFAVQANDGLGRILPGRFSRPVNCLPRPPFWSPAGPRKKIANIDRATPSPQIRTRTPPHLKRAEGIAFSLSLALDSPPFPRQRETATEKNRSTEQGNTQETERNTFCAKSSIMKSSLPTQARKTGEDHGTQMAAKNARCRISERIGGR